MKTPPASALDGQFEKALSLHHHGRLADAECIHRQVPQREPGSGATLHMLGVVARQTGQSEQAVRLLGRAIALRPDFAEGHNSRRNALRSSNRATDALAAYVSAIAARPDRAMAQYHCGNILRDPQRPADALAGYDQAIAPPAGEGRFHSSRGAPLFAGECDIARTMVGPTADEDPTEDRGCLQRQSGIRR